MEYLICYTWVFRIYGTDLENSEKNAFCTLEAANVYLDCIFKILFITVLNLKILHLKRKLHHYFLNQILREPEYS